MLVVLTGAPAFSADIGVAGGPEASPALRRISEIKKQRAELVSELVAIHNTRFGVTWPTEENHYAARMLAEFQSPEGIEFLVQYVSYDDGGHVSSGMRPLPHLLNWWALVGYGQQIGYTVVAHTATPSRMISDEDQKLLAWALLGVYGGDEAGRAQIAGLFKQVENIAGTNNEGLQRFQRVIAEAEPVRAGR